MRTSDELRELRDEQLDAVSGGLVVPAIIQPLIALGGIGPGRPANADAMAVQLRRRSDERVMDRHYRDIGAG